MDGLYRLVTGAYRFIGGDACRFLARIGDIALRLAQVIGKWLIEGNDRLRFAFFW